MGERGIRGREGVEGGSRDEGSWRGKKERWKERIMFAKMEGFLKKVISSSM